MLIATWSLRATEQPSDGLTTGTTAFGSALVSLTLFVTSQPPAIRRMATYISITSEPCGSAQNPMLEYSSPFHDMPAVSPGPICMTASSRRGFGGGCGTGPPPPRMAWARRITSPRWAARTSPGQACPPHADPPMLCVPSPPVDGESVTCSGMPANPVSISVSWADAVSCASVSGLDGSPPSSCSMPYQVTFADPACQAIQPCPIGPNWWMAPSNPTPNWADACACGLLNQEMVPAWVPTMVCMMTPVMAPDPHEPLTQGNGVL